MLIVLVLAPVLGMLILRRCVRGLALVARVLRRRFLALRMRRGSVRLTLGAALQLSPLALRAASHSIFLLVPSPALRCIFAAQRLRRGLRALNLGLRLPPAMVVAGLRRLLRLRRPVEVWLAMMPKLRSRCPWRRGGGLSRRSAPVSLGHLSALFGLRWALLLHRLGPLGRWIEVLTLTWPGQFQHRLKRFAPGSCRLHPREHARRQRAGRAALPDFWCAFRRLRDISGSRLTEAAGASESTCADAQYPHCCTQVWNPHHRPGHPPNAANPSRNTRA